MPLCLSRPVGRVSWMIPQAGTCRLGFHVGAESAATVSPMQIGRVKPASQLHASRVCFVYIKPILDPRKWQVSALWPNAASEPSSRSVPAMSALCPNRANMASLPQFSNAEGREGQTRQDVEFGHLGKWHGQQGSNLRPAVLETAALPTELCPYRGLLFHKADENSSAVLKRDYRGRRSSQHKAQRPGADENFQHESPMQDKADDPVAVGAGTVTSSKA